jgi:uncharacterized protein YdhG (YjbR/CyaY superfamily)
LAVAAKPKSIDEYLAGLSGNHRVALERLRQQIKSIAPRAEECISYGLAAFRLDGHPLVAFGAWSDHCAFYPMSASTLRTLKDDLKQYQSSKGTLQFLPDNPLPAALVRKLVKARMAENARRYSGRKRKGR